MKKRIISLIVALATVSTSFTMLNNTVFVNAQQVKQIGTTYYISSLNGDNQNSGTSPNKPWGSLNKLRGLNLQPGDKILLEKGSVFTNEYLHLFNQKGTQENPIVIDSYGEGNAPLIETNGQGVWYQNYGKQLDNPRHKNKGYVSSSILLYDSEYIEVNNIAMTNDGLEHKDIVYNELDAMNRTGVAVVAQDNGTLDHIHLNGLDISNVKGNVYDKHMNNGGIYFTIFKPTTDNAEIPRYNDVLIENCKLDNVNRWGIAVGYTAYSNHFTASEISDETIAKYGSSNVVIQNNYIKDAGGDAITTMYCDRPLIQYNVSDGAARQINPTDYSKTDFGRVAAGIWPWKCKNAVFQYNEVFDTKPNQDAQAWDADSGDGTLYQYNYSHNNAGGAVMFCLEQAVNSTFRYNISQNDLGGVINPARNPDAHIYNNVFYIKEGVPFIRPGMSGGNMVVENNIIYNSAETPRNEDWYKETNQNKVKYSNNLYYNYSNIPANEQNGVKVDKGTQVFVNAGTAPSTPKSVVNDKSAFDGYKLSENSPAINAGKVIKDANGFAVDKDFFGNPIGPIPDIGVYESNVVSLSLDSKEYTVDNTQKTIEGIDNNLTVKQLKSKLIYDRNAQIIIKDSQGNTLSDSDIVNLDCVIVLSDGTNEAIYNFIKSTDASIHSSIFEIKDSNINVPSVNNKTSLEDVINGVQVNKNATITFEKNSKKLKRTKSAKVEDGMTMVVTAQDGVTKQTYTVRIKNEYNYVSDFTPNKQGNVWFAQQKLNSGAYVNMTTYRDDWECWATSEPQWASVGLSKRNNKTYGLLCDSVVSNVRQGGYSMAYRIPVSGKVILSFEDFGEKGNAYLRDPGNVNGQAFIKLTLNGDDIIEKIQLPNDQSGIQIQQQEIDVRKGDYIRIEAVNTGNPTKASIHTTPIITYTDIIQDVNKTKLQTKVDEVKALNKTDYTEESFAKLEEELKKAETVLTDKNATQNAVDKALADLTKALEGLQTKPESPQTPTVNKTQLQTKVDEVKALNKTDYTEESFAKLEEELKKAETVLTDKNATQNAVDKALADLTKALEGLQTKPESPQTPTVNKTQLQTKVDEVKALNKTDYTEESFAKLEEELKKAETVLTDKNATQNTIDKALADLTKALEGLQTRPESPQTQDKPQTQPPQNKPQQQNNSNNNNTTKSDIPPTADNMNIPLVSILTLSNILAGIALLKKKKKLD